jgi:hypothetical protein
MCKCGFDAAFPYSNQASGGSRNHPPETDTLYGRFAGVERSLYLFGKILSFASIELPIVGFQLTSIILTFNRLICSGGAFCIAIFSDSQGSQCPVLLYSGHGVLIRSVDAGVVGSTIRCPVLRFPLSSCRQA